jgi:hypothetical protein
VIHTKNSRHWPFNTLCLLVFQLAVYVSRSLWNLFRQQLARFLLEVGMSLLLFCSVRMFHSLMVCKCKLMVLRAICKALQILKSGACYAGTL